MNSKKLSTCVWIKWEFSEELNFSIIIHNIIKVMEGFVVTKVTFHISNNINNCITTSNQVYLHMQKKLFCIIIIGFEKQMVY